ncbi:hypothetical protein GCM10022405_33370 [Gibbsiella dentisursi]|uniref:Uncharacterized protein n=1 Tax=Gibbsiella dentisursi TaxID=796890 RepID=A0ABP7LNT3_9GAMM
MASDAEAVKNRLSTETLGWSDIHDWVESNGSQSGLSVSGEVGKITDSGGLIATAGESEMGGYKGSSGEAVDGERNRKGHQYYSQRGCGGRRDYSRQCQPEVGSGDVESGHGACAQLAGQ